MNYFEHHIGDYAQATAHLSFVEDAAYHRIIRKYYAEEKPMPADIKAVQRLVGARSKEEREAVQTVLEEFFELLDDGWHQSRCDEEIARFLDKQAKAKRSAQARWDAQRSQSERNANASANAMRTHSEGNAPQSPDTKHHIPPTPKGGRFAEFWQAWPSTDRKTAKAECEKRWKAKGLDALADQILAHITACKLTRKWQEGFEPAPLTYINRKLWEDGEPSQDTPAQADWTAGAL